MKKKTKQMKKQKKRKLKKGDRGIVDLIMIKNHFFREFNTWISEMTDPRDTSYTTYNQEDLIYMGILKNMCSQHSMREMEENFNYENCIKTLRILAGDKELDEMPHYDTLNYYLEKLSPECLSELRRKMVKSLIRGKMFNKNRLLGKYWRVVLDGTGLFYFKEKHCENCLRTTIKTADGKRQTVYYHKVLEAKLILAGKVVISIGTEFIENESEDVSKQDCELNAAKRLLKRLHEEYPRLPIVIQGDALYAVEPFMELCRETYHWEYIFTHKGTRQQIVDECYEYIKSDKDAVRQTGLFEEKGTAFFENGVDEVAGKSQPMNLFEYEYECMEDGEKKKKLLQWVTSLKLSRWNIEEMILAARGRWKIENEGFNNQKHGIYKIEHLNSRNPNAMKNHYLLTQIADILMQLYLAWNPFIKKLKQTIRHTCRFLLETFRWVELTEEDIAYTQRYTTIYLE